MTTLKADVSQAIRLVEEELSLLTACATPTISCKLHNLHDICHYIVIKKEMKLTVPFVVSLYLERFTAKEHSIKVSSIRNKRDGKNPYHDLYVRWQAVEAVVAKKARSTRGLSIDASIIDDTQIDQIADLSTRHLVRLIWSQNRSLKSQIDILQAIKGAPVVRVSSTDANVELSSGLASLTHESSVSELNAEIVRAFIDPRMIKARGLSFSDDGSLESRDGRKLSDPGLKKALETFVSDYEQRRDLFEGSGRSKAIINY